MRQLSSPPDMDCEGKVKVASIESKKQALDFGAKESPLNCELYHLLAMSPK